MFICINGSFDVQRAKAWRCCQNHDVHVGLHDFLVSIESMEDSLGGDICAIFAHRSGFDPGHEPFGFVFKDIRDGVELSAFVGIEGVDDGSCTSTSTSYESNFDRFRAHDGRSCTTEGSGCQSRGGEDGTTWKSGGFWSLHNQSLLRVRVF